MRRRVTIILGGIIVFAPILVCSILFVRDWIKTEIEYERWLSEDPLRLDFSRYKSKEEIREALLVKLPFGSSEEKVKAFFEANKEQGYTDKQQWLVGEFPCGYVLEGEGACEYGSGIEVWETSRGHIFNRLFRGYWIIIFILDPQDHILTNIIVRYHGFNI